MRYPVPSLFVLFIAAALTASHPSAQQAPVPQQPPPVTFRAEANFVEVHAIVTDGSGAFVRGLTADDFEIFEDGQPVKPTVFQLVDLPVEQAAPLAGATGIIEPDVRQTTRNFAGRIYVLLLDDLHTAVTRSSATKLAARRFIEEYLGPDDMAAVVYTSGRQEQGQELTSSRRLLLEAIDRFVGRKLPSISTEKLAVHLSQESRDPITRDDGSTAVGRTAEGAQRARDVRDPLDPERGTNARRALQAIENISKWLADVQGRRKALLYFSEGIDYDIYEPFNNSFASALTQESQEAVAAAQRANVNIYGIDPRGLNQTGLDLVDVSARSDYPQLDYGNFRGALRELLLSQESLIGLAEQTGGLAIVNRNDVVGGLARIVLDNSRYYLLGYYSDSSRWRGRFMKLDVRAKRPGLTVRARRGYMPPNPRDAARAAQADAKAGTTPALRAALSKPVPVGDIGVRATAAPLRGTGTGSNGSVLVGLEIDGPSLRFQERDGRFVESLEVSIVAADERARVQGGDRQTFDLNLMPETYERVRQNGVRMLSRLDNLPPGRYQIRVGAHESTGAAVATVPVDVELPDYSRLPLALSGVLLTSSASGVAVTANAEVQPTDALPTPLVVRRTFTRGETLTAYVEAYDNSSQAAHTLNYSASVRGAADGRVAMQLQDRVDVEAGSRVRTHGFRTPIPLADLAPGTYVLKVEATAGGRSAAREIPFDVR